jgi:hypothetical protein
MSLRDGPCRRNPARHRAPTAATVNASLGTAEPSRGNRWLSTRDLRVRVRAAAGAGERRRGGLQLLSDNYEKFLRTALEHADLKLFAAAPMPNLTDEQRERMFIIFSMLVSRVAVRACLLVALRSEDDVARQHPRWFSWEDYMREWCGRAGFRSLLPLLLKGEDAHFVVHPVSAGAGGRAGSTAESMTAVGGVAAVASSRCTQGPDLLWVLRTAEGAHGVCNGGGDSFVDLSLGKLCSTAGGSRDSGEGDFDPALRRRTVMAVPWLNTDRRRGHGSPRSPFQPLRSGHAPL